MIGPGPWSSHGGQEPRRAASSAHAAPRECHPPGIPDVAQHPPDTRRVSMQRSAGKELAWAPPPAYGAPASAAALPFDTEAEGEEEDRGAEEERSRNA